MSLPNVFDSELLTVGNSTIALRLEVANLALVASLTWFVWDWLLTLPYEIEVIWTSRITLGSSLYIASILTCAITVFIRIPINFGVDVPVDLCASIFRAVATLQSVQIFILQGVLALRTYAVYNCSKLVLVPLLALNLASFVVNANDNVEALAHINIPANDSPIPYNGCILPSFVRAWPPLALLMIFEVSVGILMLARLGQVLRAGCSLAQMEYIVYRDGLIESAVMSLGNTALLIIDLVYPTGNSAIFRPMRNFIPLMGALACKRLLLNLRSITQSELGSTTKRGTGFIQTSMGDTLHDPVSSHVQEPPIDEFCLMPLDEESQPPKSYRGEPHRIYTPVPQTALHQLPLDVPQSLRSTTLTAVPEEDIMVCSPPT
ncbi:hypothetical protein DL93DRAFT_602071 [Clavulina sp. PMI_390]|nr:hypothetical protein DL93DRAFT_602071 [Clavulina sp. PMI_390]